MTTPSEELKPLYVHPSRPSVIVRDLGAHDAIQIIAEMPRFDGWEKVRDNLISAYNRADSQLAEQKDIVDVLTATGGGGQGGPTKKRAAEEIISLRDQLSEEVIKLKDWVNDLQSGMYVNCVYCGHRYGPGETTPVSMADALKAHVEQCSKHPMSMLQDQLAEARKEIERFKTDAQNFLAQRIGVEIASNDKFKDFEKQISTLTAEVEEEREQMQRLSTFCAQLDLGDEEGGLDAVVRNIITGIERLTARNKELVEALEAAEELYQIGLIAAEPGQAEKVAQLRRAALHKAKDTQA